MDWVYAAIVFGSLAYVGAIVVDYLNYRTGITPRIRQVEEGALEAVPNLRPRRGQPKRSGHAPTVCSYTSMSYVVKKRRCREGWSLSESENSGWKSRSSRSV